MKIVTIKPVAKPKSFADVKFTQADYEAAVKAGPKKVPFPTAVEAVRNSKGLYELELPKELAPAPEARIALPSLDGMTAAELKLLCATQGITIRKKQIRASELRKLISAKLDSIQVIEDEAPDDDGDDDGDDGEDEGDGADSAEA